MFDCQFTKVLLIMDFITILLTVYIANKPFLQGEIKDKLYLFAKKISCLFAFSDADGVTVLPWLQVQPAKNTSTISFTII